MTVSKEEAMQMFDRDLEILMDDLRGMQAHYQIAEWEAFVFLRKPDCPESYVMKYAAAVDEFAKRIVQLHATPATPSNAAMRAARAIVDYLALPDSQEPADSDGSPTNYIAKIITRHLAGTPAGDADVWAIITEVAATTCWDKNSDKIGGPTECDWCQRCRAKRLLEQRTPRFIGSPNALRKAAMDIATKLAGEYINPEIALGAIPDIESVLASYAAATTSPNEKAK